MKANLLVELDEAECKAWSSLAHYKFVMFGYWVGVWIHLNRLLPKPRPNPWKCLVDCAKEEITNGWYIKKS